MVDVGCWLLVCWCMMATWCNGDGARARRVFVVWRPTIGVQSRKDEKGLLNKSSGNRRQFSTYASRRQVVQYVIVTSGYSVDIQNVVQCSLGGWLVANGPGFFPPAQDFSLGFTHQQWRKTKTQSLNQGTKASRHQVSQPLTTKPTLVQIQIQIQIPIPIPTPTFDIHIHVILSCLFVIAATLQIFLFVILFFSIFFSFYISFFIFWQNKYICGDSITYIFTHTHLSTNAAVLTAAIIQKALGVPFKSTKMVSRVSGVSGVSGVC